MVLTSATLLVFLPISLELPNFSLVTSTSLHLDLQRFTVLVFTQIHTQPVTYFVTVSNTTDGTHSFHEVSVLNTDNEEMMTTFGEVITGDFIGTFGITSDSSNTILTFTPVAEIKLFKLEFVDWNSRFGMVMKNLEILKLISSTSQITKLLIPELTLNRQMSLI